MNNALELLKAFYNSYFVTHDVQTVLELFTDDICLYTDKAVCGIDSVSKYIVENIPRECPCVYENEHCAPGNDTAFMRVSLPEYTYNISATARAERICVLHIAANGKSEAASAKQLMQVINTVPNGICLYRFEGDDLHPIIVNEQFTDMLGEEALTYLKNVRHLYYTHVHPDDLEGLRIASYKALAETHSIDYTYRSLNFKTRKYLWIRMRGAMVEQDGVKYVYVSYSDVTTEKEIQQKLRENELALECAADNAGLKYWKYDPALDRAYLDEKAIAEFGLKAVTDNFVEQWIATGNIMPEYADIYRDAYKRIANGVKQVQFEAQIKLANGITHWARFCFTNLFGNDGKPTIAVCTAMTIDTEKEYLAKYELERNKPTMSDENLIAHALVNLTKKDIYEYMYNDGTPVPLADRTIFTGNDNARGFFTDEEEYKRFSVLNNAQYLIEQYNKGKTEFTVDYRHKKSNDNVTWMRNILHTMRDPAGSDILLFEYRYNIEDNVMRDKMYFTLASDNYDYVARINAKTGQFIVIPKEGLEYRIPPLSGNDADAVTRELAAYNIYKDDKEELLFNTKVENILVNLRRTGRFSYVYREIQPDGSLRNKRITQYYLDRERSIIVMTREDITDIIQAETQKNETLAAALEAANQASMAKSQFLSRMSHELRTPMNAIIGLSALAAGDINNPAAMQDAIGKIGISARYLLSLINDILEMSRIESGRMTLNEGLFDFEQLISSVNAIIYEQSSKKGVDYDAIVNGFTEASYIGDVTKLQQILINVLGNAVKFTSSGGKITFSMEQVRRTNEYATLRFMISDTGMGMEPEFIPHLFDAFSQESASFTSTSTGTGLGLAITKSMVDMMNGQINVQSIKNVGSVFTIDVRLGVSPESRRFSDLISAMNLSKLRALVVDDDVIVCQTTEQVLEAIGMKAEWVDSGAEAVERVREMHAHKCDFDTIFIDWKMPDMDGIETTRRIRGIVGPEVTIIIMTAYDWKIIEAQAREAGVDMFMEKPLFQSSIITAFEKIFSVKKNKINIPAETVYDFSDKRILLAEDHPLNVEVAKRLLEKVGATVIVANNGLEALEAFTTAENHYFDAILMDVRMPVMDGLTAAKNIRNLKKTGSKTIPIIAMTANAFDEDVELSLSSGMDAHLIKPIVPQTLFAALQKLMQRNK